MRSGQEMAEIVELYNQRGCVDALHVVCEAW